MKNFCHKSNVFCLMLLAQLAPLIFLSASGRTYNKLMWKTTPLCSKSSNKSSTFLTSNIPLELISDRKLVERCGLRCETSKESCFAFQINVTKSASGDAYDLLCYHFSGLPDGMHKDSTENCSLYVSDYPAYINISSWAGSDASRYSTDPNPLNVKVMGHQCYYSTNRGVNIYTLSLKNSLLYDFRNFDFYYSSTNALAMKDYFMSVELGTVLVGQTCDEPSSNIGSVLSYLKSVNLDVSNLQYRGKWMFVWQQGAYEKALSFVDNSLSPLPKQFIVCNTGEWKHAVEERSREQCFFNGEETAELKWTAQPLFSNSSRKNLIYHKSGKTGGQLDRRGHVMKCAFRCQASNGACFAFQVDLMKTEVFCYHFSDLPDSIYYVNLSDDCFLYSAEKGINLFQVDIQSLQILNFRNFDVLNHGVIVTELLRQYLLSLEPGTVLIGRTCDEARTNLEKIFPYLLSVNLNATDLVFRGKWIFVWQQGAYDNTLSFIFNLNNPLSKQFVFANSDWLNVCKNHFEMPEG
ncbi:hypothetical protein HELRODRAFT_180186 [Helobdella robusta]|uniref:ILEI/PANDER domain-containing protein n=1 Tax=Helobdella robusta TaxID=6412 RepID=T1FFJ9_HELRO|nr:hypothetical protein HELRODRAFT_180186 [Helobdella robusta]ESN94029.1 hypothetical protein HELRODRAFT_180186 [Helobdella robusta]